MALAVDVAGSIPAWVTLALLLAVGFRLSRGGGGAAVQELSKANEVLSRRVNELGREVRDLRVENGKLRERTDFAAVIATHERRAEARAAKTLTVLDLIAARLGPEPNGHDG